MVRSASSRVSNHGATDDVAILRDARTRAPQDDGLVLFAVFFLAVLFFFVAPVAALRIFGRLRKAARCAAASADLAHSANSSESSKRRAGNCQYEFTVTVLALV